VPRYGRAVLGGTFDRLHVGHEALLRTAFRSGKEVAIGLTTDRFLARHPKPDGRPIEPFARRRRALQAWLRREEPGRTWTVVPLEDRFGGSVLPGVDVLIASPDTRAGALAVNRERERLGRRPVPILTVPLVLAEDLRPVSSRRIRQGEIDREGHRRSPIAVAVVARPGPETDALRRALAARFPRVRLVRPRAPGAEPAELTVTARRHRAGGWRLSLRSSVVRLPPVEVPAGPPAYLARALGAILRPVGAPGRRTGRRVPRT
jgi:pantetheine-phosphate adenylyltransferase